MKTLNDLDIKFDLNDETFKTYTKTKNEAEYKLS